MGNTQDNAISNAIQWLCSPRGGNNFYGRIMNGVRRIEASGLNSAGVTIDNNGHFIFVYDLEWFSQRPVPDQLFILQHEACHLILQHIPRVAKMYRELSCGETLEHPFNYRIINIAMDCAVNGGLLHKVMKTTLDPEHPYVDPERDLELPTTLMFEEYLGRLIEKAAVISMPATLEGGSGKGKQTPQMEDSAEEQEQNPNSGGSNDAEEEVEKEKDVEENQEGGASESNDEVPFREEYPKHPCDFTKQLSDKTEAELERMETEMGKAIKETVKKAYEQTMRRRGTIPKEVKQIIEDLLKEPQVPWEHLFRNMMRSALTTKMVESALIPAYNLLPVMGQGILPYPGLQNDLSFNLSIHMDTSGSMSDEDFMTCMTEVAGIIKTVQGVRIHLVMFDAVIQFENFYSDMDIENIKRELKTHNTNSIYRYGRGGTDFNPSFKLMAGMNVDEFRADNCGGNYEEHSLPKPDMMLILTDGCAPVAASAGGPIPTYEPNCPVIWVICGGTNAQVDAAMGQRVILLN